MRNVVYLELIIRRRPTLFEHNCICGCLDYRNNYILTKTDILTYFKLPNFSYILLYF